MGLCEINSSMHQAERKEALLNAWNAIHGSRS